MKHDATYSFFESSTQARQAVTGTALPYFIELGFPVIAMR